MTHRARILAVLHGEAADSIPWFPDLSYWYQVNNALRPLMQEAFRSGYSLNIPITYWDQVNSVAKSDDLLSWHRKLDAGIPIHHANFFKVKFKDVKFDVSKKGSIVIEKITTPKGMLVLKEKKISEYESPFIIENPIKSIKDFEAYEYFLKHREFIPNFKAVKKTLKWFTDLGFLDLVLPRSPLTCLLIDLMGIANGITTLFTHPEECEGLFEAIEEFESELFEIAGECPGTVAIFADNIDNRIVSPKLYKKYMLPYYQKRCKQLHEHGKIIACHMDGQLRGILPLLKETGIDVLDGTTPAPIGDFTPEDLKASMTKKMMAWCGPPAPLFCGDTPIEEIKLYTKRIVEILGENVILNVAAAVSPDADIKKVLELGKEITGGL